MEIPRFQGPMLGRVRKFRKLTQEKLAEKMGIDPGTLGSYERGKQPSLRSIEALAGFLEVPPVTFYREEDIRSFLDSRVFIEGLDDVHPEAPGQDVHASQSTASTPLDPETLKLFKKLPGMYSGLSFRVTFVIPKSGWEAVEPTEAEALGRQGILAGSSVKAYAQIRTSADDDDPEYSYVYATGEIASDLLAVADEHAVEAVVKTVYATLLDDNTIWITTGNSADVLYQEAAGFLVEEIFQVRPTSEA